MVLATGPHIAASLQQLGLSLPIAVEKHIKISVADPFGAVPRTAPLIIWCDTVQLPWSEDERATLALSPETSYLLAEFPPGTNRSLLSLCFSFQSLAQACTVARLALAIKF